MIHKTFAEAWNALKEVLSDTSVPREAYLESLEEMTEDLDGRLMAVREEIGREEDFDGDDEDEDQDDLDEGDDDETPEDDWDDGDDPEDD